MARQKSYRTANGARGPGLHSTAPVQERAFLVAVQRRSQQGGLTAEASLDELALLVHTAGGEVAGRAVQRLDSPHPALYIGKGKLEEIMEQRDECGYSMVVFDVRSLPRRLLRPRLAEGRG